MTSDLLLGRQQELARLRGYLTLARQGELAAVFVTGDTGIGKTRLVNTLLGEAAHAGWSVLRGQCDALAVSLEYGPWLDIAAAPAVSWQLQPPSPPLDATNQPGTRSAYFTAWRETLQRQAASDQLLLVLEDFQRADTASSDLLRYLARQLVTAPVLLLVLGDSNVPTTAATLAPLLTDLMQDGLAQHLALGPLPQAAIQSWVQTRYLLPATDEQHLTALVQRSTGGNPRYIQEFLQALEEQQLLTHQGHEWRLHDSSSFTPPARLVQLLTAPLQQVGEPFFRAIVQAALIGQEVPLALWATVAGLDEATQLTLVALGVRASILRENAQGTAVQFTQTLLRAALVASLPAAQRRLLHRRVAETLAATAGTDPAQVAAHFQQAHDPRAIPWLIDAGNRAERTGSWHTAAAHFAAVLSILDEQEHRPADYGWLALHLALLIRYEDSSQAITFATQAQAHALQTGDTTLQAYAQFSLGLFQCFAGRYLQGIATLRQGVAALDACSLDDHRDAHTHIMDGGEAAGAYRGTLAFYLAAVGYHDEAQTLAQDVLASGELTAPASADAHYTLGLSHAMQGRPQAAQAAYQQARAGYQQAQNPYLVAVAATEELFWVALPYYAGRPTLRTALAALAEAALTEAATMRTISPQLARLALLVLDGEWREAETLDDIALTTLSDSESFVPPEYIGFLAYYQDDTALAWSLINESLPAGTATPIGSVIYTTALGLQRLAALLALEAGESEQALDWLLTQERWLEWGNATYGRAEWAVTMAEYLLRFGERQRAKTYAAQAMALALEPDQPLAQIAVKRLLAQIALFDNQPATATAEAHQALQLAQACQIPYQIALTQLVLAEIADQAGKRDQAEQLRAEARSTFSRLGARAVRQIRDRRTGSTIAALAAPPLAAALTNRETEVLRLLAQGQTNQAIADLLGISRKTVINHVSRILQKTHTTNRAAATAFALRAGLA